MHTNCVRLGQTVEDHLMEIAKPTWRGRTRAVAVVRGRDRWDAWMVHAPMISSQMVVLCARSVSCIQCERAVRDLRLAGLRIVDIGVLSPVEMQPIGDPESTSPATS